jgi:hypothetical protein
MSGTTAVIAWAALSVASIVVSWRMGALNPKEKVAAVALVSGVSAGVLGGFTVSDTVGLFVAAGMFIATAVLMGYEG